ncbi:DUF1642 domain-containing protein [Listeria booriae]|uniref:DUF1642 domain-containing protein n=1 Tax=Listeria booriae TaxID=1552123 RepID=A0A841ZU94_9LIST|nr:DUF1642 domain-containing protein [Listeria booriae]MBC1564116.1 DUF1642 domain-containing protein [Listeria booriae]
MTHKFKVGDRVHIIFRNELRIGTVIEVNSYNDCKLALTEREKWFFCQDIAPAPALVKVPAVVDKFLKTDADGYTTYDRMAQLIVVNDGDHYYLEEAAVENEVLSREEALEVINYAHEAKCEDLLQLVNGYEVEKEPLYEIVIVDGEDRQLLFGEDEYTFQVRYESESHESWKKRYSEREIKDIDTKFGTNYWAFAVSVEEETK